MKMKTKKQNAEIAFRGTRPYFWVSDGFLCIKTSLKCYQQQLSVNGSEQATE